MFGLEPEHFDLLGVVVFTYLLWVGVTGLSSTAPRWVWWSLILIGAGGLLIDGAIVFTEFLR